MAVTKITWENKTGIQNDASVVRKNKVIDEDMNEIKQVVNGNADELTTAKDNIEDLQEEFSNFENYDDTEIRKDISDIKKEQETQKTDIEELQINDSKQDELISKLKNALINAETEESKSLYVTDANKFGQLEVLGNQEQETSLYSGNLERGSISESGTVDASNRIRTAEYIEVRGNTEINVSADGANEYLLAFYNSNKEYIQSSPWANIGTSTAIIANSQFVKVLLRKTDNSSITVSDVSNFIVGPTPSPDYPSKVVCLGSNKNLLNTSLMIEKTKGGVTSKINSDGSITFNGTCTTNNNVFDFYIENATKFTFDATKDQTTISAFHVSGSITDSNDSGAYFRVNDKSYNGGYINLVNLPQQKQLTHIYNSTSGSVFCDIRFNKGVVLDNFTIKCKAANTLEDAFTYSPYGQGSTLISKINKNFYDKTNAIQRRLWGNNNSNSINTNYVGWYVIVKIIGGKTYTISRKNGEEENS